MTHKLSKQQSGGATDIFALGFGTSVALWALAYILRLPAVQAPAALTTALLGVTLVAGGYFTGRYTRRGWIGGLWVGLLSGVLNLLIVLSAVSERFSPESAAQIAPGDFLLTALATVGLSAVLCILGAAFGNTRRARAAELPNWTAVFSKVAVFATFFLIIAGGLVTSHQAGLAVPDWPNSFGRNMFLLPLSSVDSYLGGEESSRAVRLFDTALDQGLIPMAVSIEEDGSYMVPEFAGGDLEQLLTYEQMLGEFQKPEVYEAVAARVHAAVFLEHAHRLWGALVGLITITLAILLSMAPVAPRVRLTAWIAVGLVVLQGVLGGLRVVETNTGLGAIHGVLAQVIFGLVVGVAVASSTTWFTTTTVKRYASAGMDRALPIITLVVLLIQIAIGAEMRHFNSSERLMLHITVAALVLGLTLFTGLRAWGLHPDIRIIRRRGVGLIHLTLVQIVLGVVALVTGALRNEDPTFGQALWATLHQAFGALLLAWAVNVMLWNRKVLLPEVETERVAA